MSTRLTVRNALVRDPQVLVGFRARVHVEKVPVRPEGVARLVLRAVSN